MMRPPRQSGIALLLVLWVLVLFSGVAVSYAYTVRAETRMTRNQLEQAQAEALAEAGVARALQALSAATELDPWDGELRRFTLAGGDVRWSARNAAGLLDLNTADGRVLTAVFTAYGLDADSAAALADAVLDWRDPDDLRRLVGAEDRDYQMQGLVYGAADAPFAHPAELQQVLGMPASLYAALRPHLVVHGGASGVNPRFAARALLLRLAQGDAVAVDDYLARRRSDPLAARLRLPAASGVFNEASSPFIVIDAQGRTPNGATAAIEVVARARSAAGGVELLGWQFVDGPREVAHGG